MKLQNLISNYTPEVQLSDYGRCSRPANMPDLDFNRLNIHTIVNKKLDTPIEGDGTLLLRYKGYEAGVVSAAELNDGKEWSIPQVQGSSSRKSYRVATCLEWQRCLADQWSHTPFSLKMLIIKKRYLV